MTPIQAIDAEITRLQTARRILTGESEPKRRGRPPKTLLAQWTATPSGDLIKSLADAAESAGMKTNRRKPRTAAQKAAQGERMRAYWRSRKAAADQADRKEFLDKTEARLMKTIATQKRAKKGK